jgi:hypothetical protein
MKGINHFAAIVAAVLYFMFGAVWYTAFGTQWLAGIGKTVQQVQQDAPGAAPYLTCFLALLLIAYTLAWLMKRCGVTGANDGARFGVTIALGIVAAQLAINYGFEGRSFSLWLINGGYALVGMTVSGGILGGWKKKA